MDVRDVVADKSLIDRVSAIFNEIRKEFAGSSDRGITIISASMLDYLLEELLTAYLIDIESKNDRNNIFYNNGPLSSFSNKILMSHSLGLISDFDKNLLNNIRAVRNKFAHEIAGASFDDDSIKAKCEKLKIPDDLLVSMNVDNKEDGILIINKPVENDIKEIFQMAVYTAITILTARRTNIIFKQCSSPKNIVHRSEFMDIQLKAEELIKDLIEETIEDGKELRLELSEERMKRMVEMLALQDVKIKMINENKIDALNAVVIEKGKMFK